MDKAMIRKYLRIASLVVFSMMIGSLITMFIKDDGRVLNNNLIKSKNEKADFTSLYEVYDTILEEYYNDVDEKSLIDGAINGMLASLDDQHTIYFDEKSKEEFDTELSGTYYGIGAQIQYVEENTVKIVKIFDGSPAEKSGLQIGDIFVSIDGKSTDGMDANDIASKLRSEEATSVKVVMSRNGENIEFNIKKANVTMFSVNSEMINVDNKKIGYIGVSIFGQKTYDQFKNALANLENEKMDSLIIDLRGNSGGYLYTVTNMLELFIPKDKILYKIQTNMGTTEYKSSSNVNRNYKIVILIDGDSASASEIMSAAMKEQYSAILVGKTTYGKGTVQTTKNLSNGAMIKYTIEKWLTPGGNNIDGQGIKPDYDIDQNEQFLQDGSRENDAQFQKAIEILNK